MKKRLIKIISFAFAILFVLCSMPIVAFAAEDYKNPMLTTDVKEDLKAMGITSFNMYPRDTSADFVTSIKFLEYGYDYWGNHSRYGLYLYLYNPSGREIDVANTTLEMAYGGVNGTATRYKKYDLELLDVSDDALETNVFYKLKVSVASSFPSILPKECRYYYLSSINIKYADADSAKGYAFEQKWRYTGYQKNFGQYHGAESTLHSLNESLEVLNIDIGSASWFSQSSNLGEDYRWEVSSVYFNVPKYFVEKYGDLEAECSGLVSVEGVYNKYAMNGLVVPNSDWYNKFEDLAGKNLMSLDGYQNNYVSNYPGCYILGDYATTPSVNITNYLLSYNMKIGIKDVNSLDDYFYFNTVDSYEEIPYICNVIESSGITSGDYDVSNAKLTQAYEASGKKKITGYPSLNYVLDGKIKDVGTRKEYTINTEDAPLNSQILTYASSASWYDYVVDFLTGKMKLYDDKDGYSTMDPIVEINKNDISTLTDKELGEKYFVTLDDAKEIKEYWDDYSEDNHIYLMRFEVNPYYAPEVILSDDGEYDSIYSTNIGMYYEKAIFEDFDILQLTYKNKNSVYTTVPVNASPITILGSLVAGNNTVDDDPNNTEPESIIDTLKDGKENFDALPLLWKLVVIIIGIVVFVLLAILLMWPIKPFLSFFGKVTEVKNARSEYREQRHEEKSAAREARRERKAERDKRKKEREKEREKERDKKEKEKEKRERELDEILRKDARAARHRMASAPKSRNLLKTHSSLRPRDRDSSEILANLKQHKEKPKRRKKEK